MQKQFKYIYNNREIGKEEFENLKEDLFKWFENSTINAVNYCSVSNFLDGKFKSKNQIYNHLKNVNKLYTELGEKHNKSKLPMSKLFVQFPDALQAVVLASCYGHYRYPKDIDWLNFKRVPGGSQAYKDACLRHSLGAEKDEESGLPEIFHQAWNKLAELQLWIEENNIDIKKFSKEYLDNLK